MKKVIITVATLLAISASIFVTNTLTACTPTKTSESKEQVADDTSIKVSKSTTKIQVAILLDTSSSMDGLIEQAKSRLWNIVNTLTTLKYNGQTPTIEIALYEYGNSNLSSSNDYIRRITPLTADLDVLSETLFSLTTSGGSEYCGAVITEATKSLEWGSNDADMKLIYIAGNEAFDQGSISYKKAIKDALSKGIFINTILCGNNSFGEMALWQDAAKIAKGKYFNINSDAKVRYVATPYDDDIAKCNSKLNTTYIGYGSMGSARVQSQMKQDENAESISASNYTERAVSKTKAIYKNESWDLVDKVKDNRQALLDMKTSELPTELQGKSKDEIAQLVEQKDNERKEIQKQITDLAKKRQDYIDEELKKESPDADDLGNAINSSILALANQKGYVVEE